MLDVIFGPQNFVNEIIWKRLGAPSDHKPGVKYPGRISDPILFYSKGPSRSWNQLFPAYDQEYPERDYRRVEPETGRRYRLDDLQGQEAREKATLVRPCVRSRPFRPVGQAGAAT